MKASGCGLQTIIPSLSNIFWFIFNPTNLSWGGSRWEHEKKRLRHLSGLCQQQRGGSKEAEVAAQSGSARERFLPSFLFLQHFVFVHHPFSILASLARFHLSPSSRSYDFIFETQGSRQGKGVLALFSRATLKTQRVKTKSSSPSFSFLFVACIYLRDPLDRKMKRDRRHREQKEKRKIVRERREMGLSAKKRAIRIALRRNSLQEQELLATLM